MSFEKSEYELQHFNFSVEQMKLENRLMVKSKIQEITVDFANCLIKKSNISNGTAEAIRNKTCGVADKIFGSFDQIFEEFDSLMEKYFSIPENVLLVEDSRHENVYTTADEEYYQDKVAEHERTFQQNAYLLTALEEELEMYNQIKDTIDRENEIADKVEQSFKLKLHLDEPNEMLNRVQEVLDKKQLYSEKNFKPKESI